MTKSKRLKPVATIADTRQRQAARLLGESERALQAREARLTELIAYRDEYITRYERGNGSITAGQLQDYRVFLSRLNEVIAQQEQLVVQARREYTDKRQRWFALYGKSRALDQAVARFERVERRDAERREQGVLDERAQYARGAVEIKEG